MWRKVLWLVGRSLAMILLYLGFGIAILWYNAPTLIEGIGAGREPVWALLGLFGAQPELLILLGLLVPAVIAGVLLPYKPSWA